MITTVTKHQIAIVGVSPPNGRAAIQKMFGNPSNPDGTENAQWVRENIGIAIPTHWQFYYQDNSKLIPIPGIRMHRLIIPNFNSAMADVWQYAKTQIGGTPIEDAIRAWLHQRRLNITGGGYNFRKVTAGSKLSLHAYGIAIDFDPLHNPRKKPLMRTLPDWWYHILHKWGFSNGCHFATPDPMHVQFATGA